MYITLFGRQGITSVCCFFYSFYELWKCRKILLHENVFVLWLTKSHKTLCPIILRFIALKNKKVEFSRVRYLIWHHYLGKETLSICLESISHNFWGNTAFAYCLLAADSWSFNPVFTIISDTFQRQAAFVSSSWAILTLGCQAEFNFSKPSINFDALNFKKLFSG